MEQLTNDFIKVLTRAEEEVSDFLPAPGEKIIVSFSEYPSFGGTNKTFLVQNEKGDLKSVFKQWDTEYNMSNWPTGVFNLDRLRIITDERSLSERENVHLKNILKSLSSAPLPKKLNEENAIVLDGATYGLFIDSKNISVNYVWRAATDDIQLFVPLIDSLIKFHSHADFRRKGR